MELSNVPAVCDVFPCREEAESDLTFLGLLIFQNKLKPQSKPVIRTLLAADIRCVMITGNTWLRAGVSLLLPSNNILFFPLICETQTETDIFIYYIPINDLYTIQTNKYNRPV